MTTLRHALLPSIATSHPLLFGLFPILFLYAQNVGEMRPAELVIPGVVVLTAVFTLFVALGAVIRDPEKRALCLSCAVIFFFSYGHIVRLMSSDYSPYETGKFTPEMSVLVVGLLVLGGVVVLTLRAGRSLKELNMLVTQLAIVLVLIQVATASYRLMGSVEPGDATEGPIAYRSLDGPTRDLYFIILDGYGRHDILKEIYGFDNSDFLKALEARGFLVIDSCWSNYCATAQSLTATLNLEYLDRILQVDRREFSRTPAAAMLKRNRVIDLLRRYGYRVAAFSTGYAPTEVKFADYYFKPTLALSEFQNHLLNSTPIPYLTRRFKSQFDLHRDRQSFILDKLGDMGQVPSPKFVFAHIDLPHPPFVFDIDGNAVERRWPFSYADGDHYAIQGGTLEEYISGYAGQVQYVSRKILPILDSILKASTTPPIIVLQGDHGPGSRLYWEDPFKTDHRERFGILNALYLPDFPDSVLYESMSPVNTFRVIFNHYFGTQFELLADESYYTTRSRPYDFIEVTRHLARPPDSLSTDSTGGRP